MEPLEECFQPTPTTGAVMTHTLTNSQFVGLAARSMYFGTHHTCRKSLQKNPAWRPKSDSYEYIWSLLELPQCQSSSGSAKRISKRYWLAESVNNLSPSPKKGSLLLVFEQPLLQRKMVRREWRHRQTKVHHATAYFGDYSCSFKCLRQSSMQCSSRYVMIFVLVLIG